MRLRPVRMDDAAFIVWLRNLDHAKGRIGDTGDEAAQRAWLEKYFARDGDYYFIIETASGEAVGTYGIYDICGKSAESGRWVVRAGVGAGIPSLLVAFRTAFETLELDELRISTVSTNHHVLSFHRELGCRQTGISLNARIINGNPVDFVHFVLEAKDWPKVRERLTPLAELAKAQLHEWEETQN